jgi:hypothetical protein
MSTLGHPVLRVHSVCYGYTACVAHAEEAPQKADQTAWPSLFTVSPSSQHLTNRAAECGQRLSDAQAGEQVIQWVGEAGLLPGVVPGDDGASLYPSPRPFRSHSSTAANASGVPIFRRA